jgi:hypothetical protein
VWGGHDAVWSVLLQGGDRLSERVDRGLRLPGRYYAVRFGLLRRWRGVRQPRHEHMSRHGVVLPERAGALR